MQGPTREATRDEEATDGGSYFLAVPPLVAYGRTLRGHAATRILLKALRQEFLDAGVRIRDDVKRLRKRVVCPADLGGASVFIID